MKTAGATGWHKRQIHPGSQSFQNKFPKYFFSCVFSFKIPKISPELSSGSRALSCFLAMVSRVSKKNILDLIHARPKEFFSPPLFPGNIFFAREHLVLSQNIVLVTQHQLAFKENLISFRLKMMMIELLFGPFGRSLKSLNTNYDVYLCYNVYCDGSKCQGLCIINVP